MTREEFKAKAKEVIDNEQFGIFGALFEYESFEEMKVAQIPGSLDSAESDMPLDDFLDKLYERIKQDSVLDQIKAEIEQNAYPIVHGVNNHEKGMTLYGILQIINKYKAGGE